MFDSAQLLGVQDIDVMFWRKKKKYFEPGWKCLRKSYVRWNKSDSGSERFFPGLEAYLKASKCVPIWYYSYIPGGKFVFCWAGHL